MRSTRWESRCRTLDNDIQSIVILDFGDDLSVVVVVVVVVVVANVGIPNQLISNPLQSIELLPGILGEKT